MRNLILCATIFVLLQLQLSVHCKAADDAHLAETYGEMYSDGELQNDNTEDDLPDYVDGKDPRNSSRNDINDSDEVDDLSSPPKFLSESKDFHVKQGQTLKLPCNVKNLGTYVLSWQKGNSLLYMSGMKIHDFNNIDLEEDALVLKNVTEADEAQYKCYIPISETDMPSVTYNVKVEKLEPPVITSLHTASNTTVLTSGDTLDLTCEAEGNPQPRISWYFRSQFEGDGKQLIIPNVTHKHAGQYRCLADNKIEPPAHDYVDIIVQYAPHVSAEKLFLNSESGLEVELKCTVHAYPHASVSWQRKGKNLKNTNTTKIIHNQKDDRTNVILVIRDLQESDFDTYVCNAYNHLGNAFKGVTLVRTPAIYEFVKPEKTIRDAMLGWKVESKSPVLEHEIRYRRKGDKDWIVVKPSVQKSEDGIYIVKHKLENLGPGEYESEFRSKNKYGWSEFSNVTTFKGYDGLKGTTKKAAQQVDSKVGAVGGLHSEGDSKEGIIYIQLRNQGGGSAPLTTSTSIIICLTTVLALIIRH